MKGFGKSDIGRKRKLNEDSIFVLNEPIGRLPNLYIVADGMGGYKGGNVASSSSIKYFCEFVRGYTGDDDIPDLIIEGVKYANRMIIRDARADEIKLGGMGTTFDAAVIDNNRLYAAHVGDSRIYSVCEKIRQITTDHSYVMELVKAGKLTMEEARWHPDKNCITRALGVNEDLLVDVLIEDFSGGYIVLCTDGLTNMLVDSEIYEIVTGKGSVEEKLERLVERANNYGGYDNISAIIIDKEVGK